jgi:lysophospholipase L1-like esterase
VIRSASWRSAAPLLTLAGLELALRYVGYSPVVATSREVNGDGPLLLDCYPSNPRGYFDIDLRDPAARERYERELQRPLDLEVAQTPWAVEVRYNSLGFRDAPIRPKQPGVIRVAMIGDSFTEGAGVKEHDTAARVLARRLEALAPGRFEVLNCGQSGDDMLEIYASLQRILPYAPDTVIYGFVLNDPVRSPEFQARQQYINDWIIDRRGLHPRDPLSLLHVRLAAFVAQRVEVWRIGRETTRWYLEMIGEPNQEGWARTQQYLRDMNGETRRRGGRLLVAIWPLFARLEYGYPFSPVHAAVTRTCRGAGIAYLDLLPTFLGHRTASLWVHAADMHPNETAHAMAAEALLPAILSLANEQRSHLAAQ